jgi:gluconate 5-dehydrogenase
MGQKILQGTPLGRLGDDEGLKGLTLLFASEAGKHITGQFMAVDGGASALIGG